MLGYEVGPVKDGGFMVAEMRPPQENPEIMFAGTLSACLSYIERKLKDVHPHVLTEREEAFKRMRERLGQNDRQVPISLSAAETEEVIRNNASNVANPPISASRHPGGYRPPPLMRSTAVDAAEMEALITRHERDHCSTMPEAPPPSAAFSDEKREGSAAESNLHRDGWWPRPFQQLCPRRS